MFLLKPWKPSIHCNSCEIPTCHALGPNHKLTILLLLRNFLPNYLMFPLLLLVLLLILLRLILLPYILVTDTLETFL